MTTRESRTDGGPAFPIYTPDMNVADDAGPGMSLRDWFAAQALVGLAADGETLKQIAREGGAPDFTTARTAYRLADAMLVQRSKAEGTQP